MRTKIKFRPTELRTYCVGDYSEISINFYMYMQDILETIQIVKLLRDNVKYKFFRKAFIRRRGRGTMAYSRVQV